MTLLFFALKFRLFASRYALQPGVQGRERCVAGQPRSTGAHPRSESLCYGGRRCKFTCHYVVPQNSDNTTVNRPPSKLHIMIDSHPFTHSRSIIATWIGLPVELRYAIADWNPTTHGNITFVIFLLVSRQARFCLHNDFRFSSKAIQSRIAWFMGIGRNTYYYGQPTVKAKRS